MRSNSARLWSVVASRYCNLNHLCELQSAGGKVGQVNVVIHCFCTRSGVVYVRDARSPTALHHINKKACRADTVPVMKEESRIAAKQHDSPKSERVGVCTNQNKNKKISEAVTHPTKPSVDI
jgi:hypothetical protein